MQPVHLESRRNSARDQFVAMCRAAAGAGFVIAFMALMKLLIAAADLAYGLNGLEFAVTPAPAA